MPHLIILCSANLDARTDVTALCRGLADTMLAQRDEAGKPAEVFDAKHSTLHPLLNKPG